MFGYDLVQQTIPQGMFGGGYDLVLYHLLFKCSTFLIIVYRKGDNSEARHEVRLICAQNYSNLLPYYYPFGRR